MMVRIFVGLVMSFYIFVSICSAMQFSQPVEIGRIGGNPVGGFSIDGADYNNGSLYRDQFKGVWGTLYEKGIARYGEEGKSLWVHYDCSHERERGYKEAYAPFFGNREGNIGANLMAGEGDCVKINVLKNDGGITLFFVACNGCVVGTEHYVMMGYGKDGKFVKYLDVGEVAEKYLGKGSFCMKGCFLRKYYCRGNTIVVEYVDPKISKNYQTPVGEFRFKWNDKAQWFGAEHIVY